MANPNAKPPKAHQFQPGNPGRPKGSRQKLATSFFDALTADFEKNGAAAIVGAREESPLGYLRVVASVIPQKIEVEKIANAVSDDELVAIIRAGQDKLPAPPKPLPTPNVESVGTA